jgi:hypothetical protein
MSLGEPTLQGPSSDAELTPPAGPALSSARRHRREQRSSNRPHQRSTVARYVDRKDRDDRIKVRCRLETTIAAMNHAAGDRKPALQQRSRPQRSQSINKGPAKPLLIRAGQLQNATRLMVAVLVGRADSSNEDRKRDGPGRERPACATEGESSLLSGERREAAFLADPRYSQ